MASWALQDAKAHFSDVVEQARRKGPQTVTRRGLSVDEEVSERWGLVTAQTAARGAVLPTIDGLIAATALVHGMTVVTRNAADLAAAGALVLNPWKDS